MSVPPPAPELLAQVSTMAPVRTRVPVRALLALVAAAAIVPAAALIARRVRPDLPALPLIWVLLIALAWAVAFLAAIASSTLPRKGEVLPDTARAGRVTVVVTAGLLLLGLVATVDAPGVTIVPEAASAEFARRWWHCTAFSLQALVPTLLAAALVLRGLFPVGGARVAAAVGAGAGAMAGLTLHFICPIGGGLHVAAAHGGGVALGAAAGMLTLARLVRS